MASGFDALAEGFPQLAGCSLVLQRPQYLVVDKPSGLLSQPGLGPHQRDSLITRLQVCSPEFRLVHRLDRETSGLILVARNQASLRSLSALFASRRVHKLYVADVVQPLSGRCGSRATNPGVSTPQSVRSTAHHHNRGIALFPSLIRHPGSVNIHQRKRITESTCPVAQLVRVHIQWSKGCM